MASFDPETFKIPGEVVHDNVVYPTDVVQPAKFLDVKDWRADEKDIIIASYPKCGTTWMSAILALIMNNGDVDLINASGKVDNLVTNIEYSFTRQARGLEKLCARSPPRAAKTHLFYKYMRTQVEDDKAKFILLLRNPKDALVSFYHHYRIYSHLGKFPGTFHDFFVLFKMKRLVFGDMFDWYRDWWNARHKDNVLVVRYEEMKRNIVDVTQRVACFSGMAISDEILDKTIQGSCFKNMQNSPTFNAGLHHTFDQTLGNFIRKGEVGDWKNHLSKEESDYIDKKCEEILTPIGLVFDSD